MTTIRVECYAGYRGEETPRRLYLGKQVIDVAEVLDLWLDPEHRYFKCRGADDAIYIVRHDESTDVWELTLFDQTHLTDSKT